MSCGSGSHQSAFCWHAEEWSEGKAVLGRLIDEPAYFFVGILWTFEILASHHVASIPKYIQIISRLLTVSTWKPTSCCCCCCCCFYHSSNRSAEKFCCCFWNWNSTWYSFTLFTSVFPESFFLEPDFIKRKSRTFNTDIFVMCYTELSRSSRFSGGNH